MDSGSTNGTKLGIFNKRNLPIRSMSKSFPANSDIKSQTVWRININKRITNTVVNVVMKDLRMYLSRIFTNN